MRLVTLAVVAAGLLLASRQEDVRAVLDTQVAAWNRGDIPAFMQTYAPDTVFLGAEVTRGRDAVTARYTRTYATPGKMGRLSFSDIEVRMLGPASACAFGRWKLDRGGDAGGPASGMFSLVLEKRDGRWQIVLDHTH